MRATATVVVLVMWVFLAYLHAAEFLVAGLGLAAIAGVMWALDAAGGIDGDERN